MFPWPLLVALVLAFAAGDLTAASPLAGEVVARRLAAGLAGWLAFVLAAGIVGVWLAQGTRASRPRRLARAELALDIAALVIHAWWLFALEWTRVVAWNLGGRDWVLFDEVLVLAPFLLGQAAAWLALARIERRLEAPPSRAGCRCPGPWVRRARRAVALLLPVLVLEGVGIDLARRVSQGRPESEVAACSLALLALAAFGVLALTPLVVRVACPSRPLPAGPLRDRLERLARRARFRFTDILIWDTPGGLVNAGITGFLPGFRYVLLTDGLIDGFSPRHVEAVFGHEVGHVAHRHLGLLGQFFLVSAALLMLGEIALRTALDLPSSRVSAESATWTLDVGEVAMLAAAAALIGLHLLFVFGPFSRLLERQADLFGSRAVSCGRSTCPPHPDLHGGSDEAVTPIPALPCQVGARLLAEALAGAASGNGLDLDAAAWRHGSMARRIAFLENLPNRPDQARRVDRRVVVLRWAIRLLLIIAAVLLIAYRDFLPLSS